MQREILEAARDVENEIFISVRSEVQNTDQSTLSAEGGLLYDRAKSADDELSRYYSQVRDCNFSDPTVQDLLTDCANKKLVTSWISYVATGTELLKNNLKSVLQKLGTEIDLRKKLYESLDSGTHRVQMTGETFEGISFKDSVMAMGYEVIEFRKENANSTEVNRGKVFFDHSTIDGTLNEHVKEVGGTSLCSVDCPPGRFITLMSIAAPGLSKCWTCHQCPDNTFSNNTNSESCTRCQENEFSVDDNTRCEEVPKNYISVGSMKFRVGVTLSAMAGVITILTTIFIFVHRDRPAIKASDPMFCYLLLASLFLGDVLTVTTLIEPSSQACNLEFYVCSLFVCFVCSNLFYRSLKIYKIFMTAINLQFKRPFIFKFLTPSAHCCFLVLMAASTAVLAWVSILHQGWLYSEKRYPHSSIHKVCTSSSFISTCYPFIVPCLLLVVTLVIAFKMRLFPHNFKETTTIFTTCLLVVVICLLFLSGYSMSEPPIKSMLRAVVYFSITQCFLFCVFLPKIVVLLKKDDLIDAEGTLSRAIQSYVEADEKRKSMVVMEKERKRSVQMEKERVSVEYKNSLLTTSHVIMSTSGPYTNGEDQP